MKIPESIIEKYQLIPSGEQVGESFMQNQIVFKSRLPDWENIRLMECDLLGNPSEYICFYNKVTKRDGNLTPEFLNDIAIDTILQFISR